jgi:RNA polymerase sigma factor (sigma-70 family)
MRMTRDVHNQSRRLDKVAGERAQAHLHLADSLAWRQYRRCGQTVPLEELLGEARLALVYAASLYDERKGVPFGAYVTMVIRHRLVQAVTFWRRGGRLDHVRFTDMPVHDPEENPHWFEPICPRSREADEEAIIREFLDQVRRAMPPRWFLILELYFVYEYTLEEIGGQFDISRERVRQLLAKAIARARAHGCSPAKR